MGKQAPVGHDLIGESISTNKLRLSDKRSSEGCILAPSFDVSGLMSAEKQVQTEQITAASKKSSIESSEYGTQYTQRFNQKKIRIGSATKKLLEGKSSDARSMQQN